MDHRVWRARAQGGYTRVYEVVDGRELSPNISVNKKAFGEQIARALNQAYADGAKDARPDTAREVKTRIADLLIELGYEQAADAVRCAPLS